MALSAALLASASAFGVSIAAAEEIELKGIHLGMSKAEYDAIVPSEMFGSIQFYDREFKLAAVPGNGAPFPQFEDDRLVHWQFLFFPAWFDRMRDAVKSKYRQLKCEASEVRTKIGVKHEQAVCMHQVGDTVLRISRYAGDIETSSVTLLSVSRIAEKARNDAQRSKNDL